MTLTNKTNGKRRMGKAAKYYSLTKDENGCHEFYYQHIIDKLVKSL